MSVNLDCLCMEDTPRSDYIAAAWNDAYERAYPPSSSYDKAEAAAKRAAEVWDLMHPTELRGNLRA